MNSWVESTICTTPNYITGLQFFPFPISNFPFFPISGFSSLISIPIGITRSAIGLKICALTARIKKYNSIIDKKKKKHYKRVSLAKSKLNRIEIIISKSLIDSNISHDKFV